MTTVYLGLGSNLGQKEANLREAVRKLAEHPEIRITARSPLYLNKAETLHGEEQPDFLNGAVAVETSLTPESLYATCKSVERLLGREPHPQKWQPRLMDIDILFWGDRVFETPRLKIPHPLAHRRWFVLKPMADIAPDFCHPLLKITVAKLLAGVVEAAR